MWGRKILSVLASMLIVVLTGTVCHASANDDLFAAIKAKDAARVKAAIASGADVNFLAENIFGIGNISPLTYAVTDGNAEVVRVLLEKGANANFRAPLSDTTALMDAAQRGDAEIVALLLNSGADVNAADKYLGYTPLLWAASVAETDAARVLLDHGAPVDAVDKNGLTALQLAVRKPNAGLIRLLLDKGADVNHRDKYSETPLFNATCRECLPGNVQLLLSKGADLNATNKWGHTAFYFAQSQNNRAVMAVLVKAGANGGKMPPPPPSKLVAADVTFLTDQCHVERDDTKVIAKLKKDTRQFLLARIALRECGLLNPFKKTRDYYRRLVSSTEMPRPPLSFSFDYLTEPEAAVCKKKVGMQ